MLFREILAVGSENQTKHINSQYGQISKFLKFFYCFIVHFNSLNLTHQLMHFYIQ